MKFIIEHLSKRFEKKVVLRDIDFSFDEVNTAARLNTSAVVN